MSWHIVRSTVMQHPEACSTLCLGRNAREVQCREVEGLCTCDQTSTHLQSNFTQIYDKPNLMEQTGQLGQQIQKECRSIVTTSANDPCQSVASRACQMLNESVHSVRSKPCQMLRKLTERYQPPPPPHVQSVASRACQMFDMKVSQRRIKNVADVAQTHRTLLPPTPHVRPREVSKKRYKLQCGFSSAGKNISYTFICMYNLESTGTYNHTFTYLYTSTYTYLYIHMHIPRHTHTHVHIFF